MGGGPAGDERALGEELARLVQSLSDAQARIVELAGGDLDGVLDAAGALHLLPGAQRQLRESERAEREFAEQRAAILNALPAHIALLDTDGRIIAVNQSWNRFAIANALADEDFCVGRNYLEVCETARGDCAEEAAPAAVGIRAVLTGDLAEFALEYPCHSPDQQRWFRLMVTPIHSGERAGAVVMHVDITTRKMAEEELRESERHYRELFESNPQPMWVFDLETLRFLAVNAAAIGHYGYSLDEFLGMTIADIRPEEDVPALWEVIRTVGDGLKQVGVWRHRTRDGRILLVEVSAHSLLFDGRRAAMVLAVDMTERIRTEEALREREAMLQQNETLLRMAMSLSRMGAWTVDLPENKLTWSDEVCDIHEVPRGHEVSVEEALGFYAAEYREAISRNFFRCIETGEPFDLELEIMTRTGKRVWIRTIGEAVRDAAGSICRVQGAFQDISARKAEENRKQRLEKQLARTLESISDAFFALDRAWCFTYLNQEAERVLQRSREALIGRVVWEEFPEALGMRFEREYRRAVEERVSVAFEEYYAPLECWFSVRAHPHEDGLAVYFGDITEVKVARERVESAERRFRELVAHVQDVFYIYAPDSDELLYVSPALERVWGVSRSQAYEAPLEMYLAAVHEDDRAFVEDAFSKQMRGEVSDVEFRIRRPDGEVRWIQEFTYPVYGEEGAIERVVGTMRDITERKQTELELETSEERFRLLSRATNDAIWDWNLSTNVLWWNEGFEVLFGFNRDEVEATIESWTSRIHPDDRERIVKQVDGVIMGEGDYWDGEYRFLRKDGSYAHVLDRGYILRDDTGRGIRMIGGITDLSERKEAELRLAEQAALLDQASDAILVRDLHNRVLFWNRRAEEIYGWFEEEVLGRNVAEILYGDAALLETGTAAVMRDGEWSGEVEHRTKGGEKITVLARWTLLRNPDGSPRSILALNADITERKRMEAQFLRSQRMESIGTLAGGIAHDLNNILAPILMSIEMLKEQTSDPESLSVIETLQGSAQRGADLVRQILGVARGLEGRRIPISPAAVAEDVRRIARDTFPRNIDFRLEVPRDLWLVHADPTQLHQVMMNLCVNARDAMPEGGRLNLILKNAILDEVFAGMNKESKPGPYVIVRVEDSGTGMTPEVQEKIFEPFFTTKDIGRGTGLGLSTTFTIVKNHGGFIHLYSEPGKGSRFKVYLPAVTTAETLTEEIAAAKPDLPRGNGELILLVDDEENIRDITRRALERFGYRVMTATNGAEGVSLYAQHRGEIAVVLTDMSMPVMDGPAMIVALKSIDPAVRVIGSSGLNSNGHVAKAAGAGVEHFVPKPYTAEVLLSTLRAVLRGNAAPAIPPAVPEPPLAAVRPRDFVEEAGKQARILVVEDEAPLGLLAVRMLVKAGHEAVHVESGETALEMLAERGGAFDIALTDIHMPGMGGEAFYRAAAARYPGLKFIFVTGDGRLPEGLAGGDDVDARLLSKPYTAQRLKDAIQAAMRG